MDSITPDLIVKQSDHDFQFGIFSLEFDPIEDKDTGKVYTESDIDSLITFEVKTIKDGKAHKNVPLKQCAEDDLEALIDGTMSFRGKSSLQGF